MTERGRDSGPEKLTWVSETTPRPQRQRTAHESTLKRGVMVGAAVLVTSAIQALAQDITDDHLGDFQAYIQEFQTRVGLTNV